MGARTRARGGGVRPLVVLDVVGLTPRLLAHMPKLASLAADGFRAELGAILPAVTCSAQSTLLTGKLPREHGVVGNGWLFRELGEVWLWRQSNRLVEGEKIWDHARRRHGARTANLFWWYAMNASTDWLVTPRPSYLADGRKLPGVYTKPEGLKHELAARHGEFPLFQFWGPGAGIASSRWIAAAAQDLFDRERPELTLVYLPHLDYDLQRFGPSSPEAVLAARVLDEVVGALVEHLRGAGAKVVALSEYGLTDVTRPVHINRRLREAGLCAVTGTAGGELLDVGASRAFAVADHQIAHVYVASPKDVPAAREALGSLDGVAEVLGDEEKRAHGLDHPRSGELIAVAAPDAWFTYYYWLDDGCAPDFARSVEIHRKPGYDPAELLFDGAAGKARAMLRLAQKKLGFRYVMDVIPLDPSGIRGSHGRLPASPEDGPVLLSSERAPSLVRDRYAATDVMELLLGLLAEI